MSASKGKKTRMEPGTRFMLRFLGAFAVLYFLVVYQFGDQTEAFLVETATVLPGAASIGLFFSGDNPVADGDIIRSSAVSLKVLRGCEGTELYLLLVSAIFAFAASWRQKVPALVAGIALVFVLNQLRLVSLYAAVRDFQDYFQLVHVYIAPLVLIALLALAFLGWSSAVMRPRH